MIREATSAFKNFLIGEATSAFKNFQPLYKSLRKLFFYDGDGEGEEEETRSNGYVRQSSESCMMESFKVFDERYISAKKLHILGLLREVRRVKSWFASQSFGFGGGLHFSRSGET